MAMNLEVFIELVSRPIGSNTGGDTDFICTQVNLNPDDYDGATYYFEINGYNDHATTAYEVHLVTGVTEKATISVPANQTAITRVRSAAFTPTAGNNVYFVRLDQTEGATDLRAYSARIVIIQVSATKTRVQIPLIAGSHFSVSSTAAEAYDTITGGTDYGQTTALVYARWLYESAKFATIAISNPFTFEANIKINNSAGTVSASLFNVTDTTQVASSEVTHTGDVTATLVTADFASDANLSNGDEYEVKIKTSNAAYTAYIAGASLYIRLTSLTKAQIIQRASFNASGTTAASMPNQRQLFTLSNFTSSTEYFEVTAFCDENIDSHTLKEDNGDDTGTAGATVVSTINLNSATKIRKRSSAVVLEEAHRYFPASLATTATNSTSSWWIVIDNVVVEKEVAGAVAGVTTASGTLTGTWSLAGAIAAQSAIGHWD